MALTACRPPGSLRLAISRSAAGRGLGFRLQFASETGCIRRARYWPGGGLRHRGRRSRTIPEPSWPDEPDGPGPYLPALQDALALPMKTHGRSLSRLGPMREGSCPMSAWQHSMTDHGRGAVDTEAGAGVAAV